MRCGKAVASKSIAETLPSKELLSTIPVSPLGRSGLLMRASHASLMACDAARSMAPLPTAEPFADGGPPIVAAGRTGGGFRSQARVAVIASGPIRRFRSPASASHSAAPNSERMMVRNCRLRDEPADCQIELLAACRGSVAIHSLQIANASGADSQFQTCRTPW